VWAEDNVSSSKATERCCGLLILDPLAWSSTFIFIRPTRRWMCQAGLSWVHTKIFFFLLLLLLIA
jgi:hypothetical protein